MRTFVIAGITGHVGSVVGSELLAHGERIKAIVRNPNRGATWRDRGAEVAVGSLEDRAFLGKTLAGAAGFFVLLPPNETETGDYFAAQRRTADVIAGGVKDSPIPHVVMLSSLGVELADGTGPIKSLHYLENALRATGKKLIAVRACYFQENIAGVIPGAREAGIYPNFLPSADMAIPMIATRDIGRLAEALLRSAPERSETVDLIGPMYSLRQLADKLGTALGKRLQVVAIPETGQVEAMIQAGLPPPVAEVYAEMYRALG
jgi:uncharacterized protein YbjT (DUF2867 family)